MRRVSRTPHRPPCGAAVLAAVLAAGAAVAQGRYTKIVDSDTLVPGTTYQFGGFFEVSVDAGQVAFMPYKAPPGIYSTTGSGPVTALVNSDMPFEGPGDRPVFIESVLLQDGRVRFVGRDANYQSIGVYGAAGGRVTRIAGPDTPGVVGGFDGEPYRRGLAASGDTTVFRTFTPNPRSCLPDVTVYAHSAGGVTRLVGSGDRLADGTRVGNPVSIVASGPTVAYTDGGSLFASTAGGPFERLAGPDTPVPGSGTLGYIDGRYGASRRDGVYAFAAGTGSQAWDSDRSWYSLRDGALTRVATKSDVGLAADSFYDFESVAVAGGRIAFEMQEPWAAGTTGVYVVNADGTGLTRLVDPDQPIDGKTVFRIVFESTGFDGDLVAFTARFTDGSSGVYTVAVPVPEPAAVLAVAAAGLAAVRRRPAARDVHPGYRAETIPARPRRQ